MTQDEFNAGFEFGFEILSLADQEHRTKMIQRAKRVHQSNFHAGKYAIILLMLINWMDKNLMKQ